MSEKIESQYENYESYGSSKEHERNVGEEYEQSLFDFSGETQETTSFESQEEALAALTEQLDSTMDKQGVFGDAWNSFKNWTNLGSNSEKCEQAIEDFKNGNISYEEAEKIISGFSDKQDSSLNLASNILSGVAAVAVVGSAVLTGGLSLGLVAAAAGVGAVTKAGMKFVDRATNEVDGDAADAKQIFKDGASGALNATVSVATIGIGTAGTTGTHVAKQTLWQAVKQGGIQGAKAGAISGAAMGAGEYAIEAAFEEDVKFNAEDMLKNTVVNAAGGTLFGGALGAVSAGVNYHKIQKLSANSMELNQTYEQNIQEAQTEIESRFGDLQSKEKISGRAKSKESILEKLINKFKRGELNSTEMTDCTSAIGDGLGTRLQLSSISEKESKEIIENCLTGQNISYEQFMSYMRGETSGFDSATLKALSSAKTGVIDALKTRQTQEIVDRLCTEITNNNFTITELNNYGDDLASYFTTSQLQQIENAYYNATGKGLKIVNSKTFETLVQDSAMGFDDVGDVAFGTYKSNITTKGAVKASGYTSAQMNVEHQLSNGTVGLGEFQIRGTQVNKFADVEHIPYDIRKGKITADSTKYSDIFEVISNMKDDVFKRYNEFLTNYYQHLRLSELGIKTPTPVISDFFTSDELSESAMKLLSPDGLIAIHNR